MLRVRFPAVAYSIDDIGRKALPVPIQSAYRHQERRRSHAYHALRVIHRARHTGAKVPVPVPVRLIFIIEVCAELITERL